MSKMIENAAGRMVPAMLNGHPVRPYAGLGKPMPSGMWHGKPMPTLVPGHGPKLITLEDAVRMVGSGDTVSWPHYYRNGGQTAQQVLTAAKEAGIGDLHLFGTAFFSADAMVLHPDVVRAIDGNCYGVIAAAVAKGHFLPHVVEQRSHGGRIAALASGEVVVNHSFIPVAAADPWGNADGISAQRRQANCGPISLGVADAVYADHSTLLTETILPHVLHHRWIKGTYVNHVVQVDCVGENSGIGSGSLDIESARQDPAKCAMATATFEVIKTAGVLRNGWTGQVGAGSGLLVTDDIAHHVMEHNIRASFICGGITPAHLEMARQGRIATLIHGQLFVVDAAILESMRHDPFHQVMDVEDFYSPLAWDRICGHQDFVVLNASEVDVCGNVNTIVVGKSHGIGGHQNAAAGAGMTIIYLPLVGKGRSGTFPRVVDRVQTIVTPGAVVDIVVTDMGVAFNQHVQRAPRFTDEIVGAVFWEDGTLLDVYYRLLN